jgi:hypothetical protein
MFTSWGHHSLERLFQGEGLNRSKPTEKRCVIVPSSDADGITTRRVARGNNFDAKQSADATPTEFNLNEGDQRSLIMRAVRFEVDAMDEHLEKYMTHGKSTMWDSS